MKHSALCAMCAAVSFIAAMPVSAVESDPIHERITYRVCGDHIEITGCVPRTFDVIIPAEIKGLPVTTIHEGAFAGKTVLYSLLLPESIIEIEADAFAGCDGLDIIYYKGSPTEWDAITVADGNQRLWFTDVYCDYNKPIVERENVFVPGKDNWCFANSSENFGDVSYIMTEEHDDLAAKRIRLNAGTVWSGSCYGMAATTILACAGILDPAVLQAGAASLYEIDAPPDLNVLSTINYYFNTQLAEPQRMENKQLSEPAAEKMQRLLDYLADDSPVLLSVNGYFGVNGYQNHAIVAYDVVYGSYEWDGISYDGKILIYDNNYPDLPDLACLYFNSIDLSSYILPGCGIISGKQGGIMSITEDLDILNYHGLFCGDLHQKSVRNRLIVSGMYSENDISVRCTSYENSDWLNGEMIDIHPITYTDEDGITKLSLAPEQGYRFDTETLDTMNFTASGKTSVLHLYATNTSDASFTPDGQILLQGTDMQVSVSLSERIAVKGNGADSMFLECTEQGYRLKSDALQNISVKMPCGETDLIGNFSSTYPEVFLHSTENGEIRVSADADGDGSYETEIPVSSGFTGGDVNFDDTINALDAAVILTAAAAVGSGMDSGLDFLQEAAADASGNHVFNSTDAALILEWAAADGAE